MLSALILMAAAPHRAYGKQPEAILHRILWWGWRGGHDEGGEGRV